MCGKFSAANSCSKSFQGLINTSCMEDSDDTVAPDLDKEELEYHGDVSEASLPCSPSILQTNNMASAPVRLHVFNCSTALSIDTGNYKNRDE